MSAPVRGICLPVVNPKRRRMERSSQRGSFLNFKKKELEVEKLREKNSQPLHAKKKSYENKKYVQPNNNWQKVTQPAISFCCTNI